MFLWVTTKLDFHNFHWKAKKRVHSFSLDVLSISPIALQIALDHATELGADDN